MLTPQPYGKANARDANGLFRATHPAKDMQLALLALAVFIAVDLLALGLI